MVVVDRFIELYKRSTNRNSMRHPRPAKTVLPFIGDGRDERTVSLIVICGSLDRVNLLLVLAQALLVRRVLRGRPHQRAIVHVAAAAAAVDPLPERTVRA